MASYEVSVSKNGKFLFVTCEQPGSMADEDVANVVSEITQRFPASEGFEVQVVEWPDRTGRLTKINN